jgi:amino-acid N-acetyltransferase
LNVDRAKIGDVKQMHILINKYADRGEMLHRALSELYDNLRDYFVIRDDTGAVVACVALHISWADLAEVRSLAVDEDLQIHGLGSLLVEACLKDAKELDIPTVFCLTYKPAFFEKLNFWQVDKMDLPRKVWSECFHCPKFPDCDEVALIYKFDQDKSQELKND